MVGGGWVVVVFPAIVSTQLQLWLFCCWGCGCCWAVTIVTWPHRWKKYFTFWLRKKIDKNFLANSYALKCKNANIKLNIFHAFTGREGRVVDHENQMATVKSLSHKGCQKETAKNRNTCVCCTLGLALFTTK